MGNNRPPDQGRDSTATTPLIETMADSYRVFVLTCAAKKSALALEGIGAEEICDPDLCEFIGLWPQMEKADCIAFLNAARILCA